MAKEIILYNLAENVTDEEYKDYVTREKGPILESLSRNLSWLKSLRLLPGKFLINTSVFCISTTCRSLPGKTLLRRNSRIFLKNGRPRFLISIFWSEKKYIDISGKTLNIKHISPYC
jgi:hypothetical protein